jgi:hypothetical protein
MNEKVGLLKPRSQVKICQPYVCKDYFEHQTLLGVVPEVCGSRGLYSKVVSDMSATIDAGAKSD